MMAALSKLSCVIRFAPDIKKFYFIDGKHRSAEYEKFMRELMVARRPF